ncbi:MAG: efflux RND transporter permease subunit [Armatimonadetes bacterium]|nr:efflux RND transporter permease subunit [Armatimonadota bacterium]
MITAAAIRRPVFVTMLFLAVVLMGWIARARMPAEMRPKVDLPFITIVTTYTGAGPQEIETLISKPIEDAVGSISRLKNITSTSQDGISVVSLEFELGTDIDAAAADVREKVDSIRRQLPNEIDPPSITKADISAQPVMSIGMEGPISPRDMRYFADEVVKDRLARVPGAAAVAVSGGDVREIQVLVDKRRLDAYNLTINDVALGIQRENINVPGGSIKQGRQDYAIRVVGEFDSAQTLANMRLHIPDTRGGGPGWNIALSDVATVKDTIEDPDQISKLNGKPAVILAVQKQTDANTVDVADGAKKELAGLQPILPPGVKFIIATDESDFVKEQLHDTNRELLFGILLVVIVVFVFLHSARATLIVSIAIPTSIIATFLPMSWFGFTLNFMTMLALSLAVGILVDDAIVVLENIDRHLEEGEPPREAAINGRTEIALAAVTITMVDVVVFIPIAFMGGIVGEFFRSFGITVATATLFSLLVSFTLTPMMASRFYKRATKQTRRKHELERHGFWERLFERFEARYQRLEKNYERLLHWSLENRWLTFVIGLVSLTTVFIMLSPPIWAGGLPPRLFNLIVFVLILGLLATRLSPSKSVGLLFMLIAGLLSLFVHLPIKGEFIPEVDQGQIGISVEAPAGSSLKYTERITNRLEGMLKTLPETRYYLTSLGSASAGAFAGAGNTGPQYARISLQLVDKTDRRRGMDEIMVQLRQEIARSIAGAKITVASADSQGGGGTPIAMEVTGADMQELNRVANRVAEVIRSVPGARDVDTSWKIGRPELEIHVDRDRAMDVGISTAQIAQAVRTSVEGDTTSKFRVEGTEYNIRVQVREQDRAQLESVKQLIVGTANGAPVYLDSVADVRLAAAPTKIDRKNRQRLVTVSAFLQPGAPLANVQQQISNRLASLPTGNTTIRIGGTSQMMQESFRYIISALLLAIALVYMLQAGLFESLFNPLVIMISLPQALVGAILMLVARGQSLSITSMIGFIMLMGIVTKNAILLIDYTNTLRARGLSRREAILQAGPTRLRPILMTTFSLLAALTPTMLFPSRGSEQRAPLATAVVGGLIVSTLLTLLVVPASYSIMEDVLIRLRRVFGGLLERVSRIVGLKKEGGE